MKRVYISRVPLDSVHIADALDWISAVTRDGRTSSIHVVTPNAQFVQIARSSSRFAQVLRLSDLSVADGVPLVWACRLLGHPIPGRINGTDLMVRLCKWAAEHNASVYLLGGRPGAADLAASRLVQSYPGLRIAGVDCPAMDFMNDPLLDAAVSGRIQTAKPDLLFVGLGAPKQEFWIQDHRYLPAKVMVGIGGSFELVAGLTRRAPERMQKAGLEWLWRLIMEPRRLFTRYLVGNTLFILIVLQQWIRMSLRINAGDSLTGRFRKQAK